MTLGKTHDLTAYNEEELSISLENLDKYLFADRIYDGGERLLTAFRGCCFLTKVTLKAMNVNFQQNKRTGITLFLQCGHLSKIVSSGSKIFQFYVSLSVAR